MNLFLLVWICFNSLSIDAKDGEAVCQTAGCEEAAKNIQLSYDPSVNPCDDFYRFTCGKWIAKHEIPGDSPAIGATTLVNDATTNATKQLLETNLPTTVSQPIAKLLRSFYQKCMAAETINTVDPTLTEIVSKLPASAKEANKLSNNFGNFYGELMAQYAVSPFFGVSPYVDEKEVTKNILYLEAPELILSAPEYYSDSTYKDRLDAYKTYIKDVLEAIKSGSSVGRVEGIIKVETEIAKAKAIAEAKKDESENYNKMSINELKKTVTKVDWTTFFNKTLPVDIRKKFTGNANTKLVVHSLVYFKAFDQIAKMDTKDFINFGYWSVIQKYAPLLGPKFADLRFVLLGTDKPQKRSDLCISQIKNKLDVAVGALYVDKYFSSDAKKEAENMVNNMKDQLPDTFSKLDWMDDKTKKEATKKGKNSVAHVGYAKYVKNNAELEKYYKGMDAKAVASESSFLQLQLRVAKWKQLKDLNVLNEIPDRTRYDFDASEVNAGYEAEKNTLVFNAGILQPPFFKETYPKFINYGCMGAVIGHEILHGYDSDGSKFDEIGTRRDWWSNSSAKNFKDKVKCVVDKFNNYNVKQVSMKVKGDKTKEENVADMGGLKLAYKAYLAYVNKNGKEPKLPYVNLTNSQAFFVSIAMFHCQKSKNAALINQINTDKHAPVEQRVLGMMSNSKEFADAFNCKANSNYNPSKKCLVY